VAKSRRKGRGTRRGPGKPARPPSRRGLPGNERPVAPTDTVEPVAGGAPASEDGERLVAHWQSSRAGARAGRGFHFQDAVGAWLAAQIAVGEIQATMLVPEGLEDLWLSGSLSIHVQVKSRVERLGPFPAWLASRHIMDACDRPVSRATGGGLMVALERGVEGEAGLGAPGQTGGGAGAGGLTP
jgi:hypothetical protein